MTDTQQISEQSRKSLESALWFWLRGKHAVVAYPFDDAGMCSAAGELVALGVVDSHQPRVLEVTGLSGSQVFGRYVRFKFSQVGQLKAHGFKIPASASRVGSLTKIRRIFNEKNVFHPRTAPNYLGDVPGLRHS